MQDSKMPIGIPTENWTKFPNCLLDNLPEFETAEFMILAFMVRKNIGFQNITGEFSISFLVKHTGIKKDTVRKSINLLLEKECIKITGYGKRGSRFFGINWIDDKNMTGRKNRIVNEGEKIAHNRAEKSPSTGRKNRNTKRKEEKKKEKETTTKAVVVSPVFISKMKVKPTETELARLQKKVDELGIDDTEYFSYVIEYANEKSNQEGKYFNYIGICLDHPEFTEAFIEDQKAMAKKKAETDRIAMEKEKERHIEQMERDRDNAERIRITQRAMEIFNSLTDDEKLYHFERYIEQDTVTPFEAKQMRLNGYQKAADSQLFRSYLYTMYEIAATMPE